jgi:micrococcal nuclease
MRPSPWLRIFVGSLLCLLLSAQISLAERVARVIDGDTIVLESGERVRYIGIDTPESVHPRKSVEFMAREASEYNRALVDGKDVRLEYDVQRRDRYGRLLAYVFVDSLFVNYDLVASGYAQVSTYPPNVRYVDQFVSAQRWARELGLGLWDFEAEEAWRVGDERWRPSTSSLEGVPASTSSRCQAITRKGTQCRRRAKLGMSYCWQHGW